jgi:hypothetical protein
MLLINYIPKIPSSVSRKYGGGLKIGPKGIPLAFFLKFAHFERYSISNETITREMFVILLPDFCYYSLFSNFLTSNKYILIRKYASKVRFLQPKDYDQNFEQWVYPVKIVNSSYSVSGWWLLSLLI